MVLAYFVVSKWVVCLYVFSSSPYYPAFFRLDFQSLISVKTSFLIGALKPSGLNFWSLITAAYPTWQRSKHDEGWAGGSESIYGLMQKHSCSSKVFNKIWISFSLIGSGKTYTMVGTPGNPGCMVRALNDLFEAMGQTTDVVFKVTHSNPLQNPNYLTTSSKALN